MKLCVIGCTGSTGLAFVNEGLKHDDINLVLYARSPGKLPDHVKSSSRVRIVEGQLGDAESLQEALKDVDAVLTFLGASPEMASFYHFLFRVTSTPLADTFPALFEAMRKQNVKRILALSALSYNLEDEAASPTWWAIRNSIGIVAPRARTEMRGIAAQVVAQDDLDWTVFRVPIMSNGSAESPIHAGKMGEERCGWYTVTRASLSRWLISEIREPHFIRQCPAVCN